MSEAKPFASLSSGLLARKGAAKPAMRRPNTVFNPEHVQENGQDDLGWNDMGYDVDPDISKEAPTEKQMNPLARAIAVPKPEVKQQQDRIAAQLQIAKETDETADEPAIEEPKADEANVAPIASISQIADKQAEASNIEAEIQPQIEPAALKPSAPESVDPETVDQESIAPKSVVQKPIVKKAKAAKKPASAKTKAAFTLRLDPERHLKLRLACAINNISAQKFVTDALDKKLSEMDQIDHLSGQIIEK